MSDEADPEVPEGAALFPLIPAELGVHPLLLAVLHATIFLDGSADEIVNADAAEEALHYFATYLQRLQGAELRRVREDLLTLVGFAKQEKWSKQDVRFLKEFLEHFGVGAEKKET
jgi:hypothetical protein